MIPVVTIRRIADSEHEVMSLLTARLFLDTIAVSYQDFCTPENLACRNVWLEAKECDEWLLSAQGRMVVAFEEDRLVGYAVYCPNAGEPADHDWSLEGFFVLPALQGRGIGARLLDAAVRDMAEAGARKLVVATFAGSAAERYYLGTGARLLFQTMNEHFGKPNTVSFLGWSLVALTGELDSLCRYHIAGGGCVNGV